MSVIERIKKAYEYLTEDNSKDWSKREYHFYLFFCEATDQNFPWNYRMWNEHIEQYPANLFLKQ